MNAKEGKGAVGEQGVKACCATNNKNKYHLSALPFKQARGLRGWGAHEEPARDRILRARYTTACPQKEGGREGRGEGGLHEPLNTGVKCVPWTARHAILQKSHRKQAFLILYCGYVFI